MPLVTVRVEQRHCNRAKRGSSCHCPLANASNEVLPYGRRVAVGKDSITVLGIGPAPRPASVTIPLPAGVADVIASYDAGGPMALMTFKVHFPDL